jgi:predicted RNA methylase
MILTRYKRAFAEAIQVLEALGGVLEGRFEVRFDFDASEVLNEVILSGCIPDRRSHQFYPTPPAVAAVVLEAAQIGERDRCLEPSAGQGALAALMPRDRTLCIEISALHCAVLTSKGCRVEQRDFLEWAQGTSERFDRICMNPPFADGRARSHVEAAAGLLKPGGRLVAVLPASMKDKLRIEDLKHTWSDAMTGEFDHTGVSVVVATLVRPAVVLPFVEAA